MSIYLDYNATTPVDPQVLDRMTPYFTQHFGNPASNHQFGRRPQRVIAEAESAVASLLKMEPRSIVWTSGATEALNMVLKGILLGGSNGRREILYSAGEHKAVTDTATWLQERGYARSTPIDLSATGEVDYGALDALINDRTLAVCVMAANNETGVLNDLKRVSALAHQYGAILVCDATQQAGKLPLELGVLGVDFVAISAHKIYGPKGIGALAINQHTDAALEPLIHGGGHQRGLRSGTLNVPGVAGFGGAAELAAESLPGEAHRLTELRDYLERLLEECASPITIHGAPAQRLPNTANVRIHGVDADALIANCPDVSMSSGSACTSAVPTPSHVLNAMGVPPNEADESVRLSLGRFTTEADIEKAAELIGAAAARIRQMNA